MVFYTHYSIFSLLNLAITKKRKKTVVCAQCLSIFTSYFLIGSNSALRLSIPLEFLLLNSPVSYMSLNLVEVSKSHDLHDSVVLDTANYSLLSEILSTLDLHDTTSPNFVPISLSSTYWSHYWLFLLNFTIKCWQLPASTSRLILYSFYL